LEIKHLKVKKDLIANSRQRRGTIAVGAIAIILVAAVVISSIVAIAMEYNAYSKNVASTTETAALKAKENLLVQASTSDGNTAVTVTNEGSTPSIIIAAVAVNPTTNSLSYYSLASPVACSVLGDNTFTINQPIQQNWPTGVLTSLGNVFWNTNQQTPSSSPSPSPSPSPTPTPTPQPWLAGWNYRISHVINAAAGAGTGYQVMITVHYASGTSSGSDAYVNGLSRTDFGDVRFTDGDMVTQLNYWMENMAASNYRSQMT